MLAEYIKTFHASKFLIFHISLCREIPASRNGYTINQPAHLKLHQLYITMMQNSSTIVKEILLLKLMTEIFYLLNSLINHWKHFTTKWKNRRKKPRQIMTQVCWMRLSWRKFEMVPNKNILNLESGRKTFGTN